MDLTQFLAAAALLSALAAQVFSGPLLWVAVVLLALVACLQAWRPR